MEREKWGVIRFFGVFLAVWVGFFLRLAHFFSVLLQPDEALFATWGRVIASGRDPFLIGVLVDKPPLLFYLQAISFGLLGQDQVFAARVPNLVAGILLIPITFSIIQTMRGGGTIGAQSTQKTAISRPIVSPLLIAVTPMLVYFSASGFTDMLMLTLAAAAVLAMLRGRAGWAGVWLGLALWAKLTAVLLLPLVILVGAGRLAAVFPKKTRSLVQSSRPDATGMGNRARQLVGKFGDFGGMMRQLSRPYSWFVGLLVGWLGMTQGFGNWWGSGDGQLVGGIRPISPPELLPRLAEWLGFFPSLLGIILLIFVPLLIYYRSKWGAILLLWMGGYFGFHWLLATAVYDRYMLPLVWVGILVVGVGLGEWELTAKTRRRQGSMKRWLVWLVILVFGLWGWGEGERGKGKGQQEVGESGVVAAMEVFGGMPYGTVVYDHWYSWQLRYYLFESKVLVQWVADPEGLVEDLAVFYDQGRFIVLPNDGRGEPFVRALGVAGYRLEKQLQSGDIVFYRIVSVR